MTALVRRTPSGSLIRVATPALLAMASVVLASSPIEPGTERLKEMTGLARAVHIRAIDRSDAAGELVVDPLNRYDDQPRRIEDATLWAFGGKGRPIAMLKVELYPEGVGLYGVVALAPGTITAEGDGWSWASTAPGLVLSPMPKAPAPADSVRERLAQMKGLARRFSGHEDDGPVRRRLDLRLLPRPIHRYSDPDSGLVDGAIFALATGTNPDVLLIFEARTAPGAPRPSWNYGLARLGGSPVRVALDDHEVWSQTEALPPAVRATYMNRLLKRTAATP